MGDNNLESPVVIDVDLGACARSRRGNYGDSLEWHLLKPKTAVIARSEATKQSPSAWLWLVRLLRYARNDKLK